jgi:5-methylcytosine-specific restriction endonuclease McrA
MSEQNLFEHLIDQKLAELKKSNKPRKSNIHSRYISQNVQDQVKKRSQNRCEHLEKGARCNGVYRLHFDHKIPFSKGGKSELENIQHLCAQHNWHKSDKLL